MTTEGRYTCYRCQSLIERHRLIDLTAKDGSVDIRYYCECSKLEMRAKGKLSGPALEALFGDVNWRPPFTSDPPPMPQDEVEREVANFAWELEQLSTWDDLEEWLRLHPQSSASRR